MRQRFMFNPMMQPKGPRRRRRRRRLRVRRFRAEWVLVPGALLFAAWFLGGIESPAFTFEEWMWVMNVQNQKRFRDLATLALLVLGGTLIWRIVKSGK